MIKTLSKINMQGKTVGIKKIEGEDYLCLSDMAASIGKEDSIKNWIRNKDTIEFLGTREKLHNPNNFNIEAYLELRKNAGTSRFVLSPQKWKTLTNAIGVVSSPGKGGGTYAHIDIALEFAAHLNPAFKLYLIKDYQRLKKEEQEKISSQWDQKRALSKINYGFMTDSIKNNLIPDIISKNQIGLIYAEEADLINIALFNSTAQERRAKFPKEANEGFNMRDFATPEQLVVLANLEFKNSELIAEKIPQSERLVILNNLAISQMTKLAQQKTPQQVSPNIMKKYLQ